MPSLSTPSASRDISRLLSSSFRRRRGSWLKRLPSQIFRQIGIDQPDLAAFDGGVALLDVGVAFAQRLHLGAGQSQACLDRCRCISYEKRALRFSATVLPPLAFLSLLMARHIKPASVERKPATVTAAGGSARLASWAGPQFSRPACLQRRVDLGGGAFFNRHQRRAHHVLDPAEPRQAHIWRRRRRAR